MDQGPPSIEAEGILRGASILVVDDDELTARSLSRVLTAKGCRVTCAHTVGEAIGEIDQAHRPFEAAVVDFFLFDHNAVEVITRLRAGDEPCCALMITGLGRSEAGREAIAAGADDFLLKPFDLDDFLDAVSRTVERTMSWRARLAGFDVPRGDGPSSDIPIDELHQVLVDAMPRARAPSAGGQPSGASTHPRSSSVSTSDARGPTGGRADLAGSPTSTKDARSGAGGASGRAHTTDATGSTDSSGSSDSASPVVEQARSARSQTLDLAACAGLLSTKGGLSVREREILEHLLLGKRNHHIADLAGISERTVKFHVTNILKKLGAESRGDLLRMLFDGPL